MHYAIFDYTGAFLRSSFAHVENVIPVNKTITRLLLSRLQGNKPHPFRTLPPEPTPTRPGTLRNPAEPYQHSPELSRTLRNLARASGHFDFQIVLARRRGANFADFNFQKCSDHASFERF